MSNDEIKSLKERVASLERKAEYDDRMRNQHIAESAREIDERYGLKPGELQWKWRNTPPDKFDYIEAQCAVIDALSYCGGFAAWKGDATGCVTQIILAVYRKLEVANKRISELESDNAILARFNQSDIDNYLSNTKVALDQRDEAREYAIYLSEPHALVTQKIRDLIHKWEEEKRNREAGKVAD